MDQPQPKRYIFSGHASGVAAHIRRPENRVLPVQGASSLPVIGGLSESKVGPVHLGQWVSFDSAATSARGDFVNSPSPRGKAASGDTPTETRVTASVLGLEILQRVFIGRAAMGLVLRNPEGKGQPPIRLEGTFLDGVRIDNSRLKITLAEKFFSKYDTREKLVAELAAGLPRRQERLFTSVPKAKGPMLCTIVQEIAWDGPPHPDATIQGNAVVIPRFGTIYFGELVVNEYSRNLNMVRVQLGATASGRMSENSPVPFPPSDQSGSLMGITAAGTRDDVGGEVMAAGGETSGVPYPPS
jgi:hypothetical protein